MKKISKKNYGLASFLLRAGLAVAFFYAAFSAFMNPNAWTGYIPGFMQDIIPPTLFLHIHSIFNLFLGLWLLSGKKAFYSSIVSALAMLAIIGFNMLAFDIVFRDIAIFFMALALAVIEYGK